MESKRERIYTLKVPHSTRIIYFKLVGREERGKKKVKVEEEKGKALGTTTESIGPR